MKILKQNYRVMSEKGSYSLEIWLLEVPPKDKILVPRVDEKVKKLEFENL